ncbi:unnamed protein product [Ascophyllum nodosum]
MEWIGWNVLLEGSTGRSSSLPRTGRAARDVPPAPNAFGPHNISAGWQSDTDLYRQGTRTLSGDSSASWPSTREAQITEMASSGVQEPGDVVIIPPRHWHQVYHLEPSVAVASQYMDYRVRRGVFHHILGGAVPPKGLVRRTRRPDTSAASATGVEGGA